MRVSMDEIGNDVARDVCRGAEAVGGLKLAGAARMAVAGAIGWALAAMFIRYANGAGLFHGPAELVVFASCFPVAWATARLLRVSGRVRRDQMVPAMSVALMAALFLDGVALTNLPFLYGAPQEALLPAAAWLLFGVGAFIGAAFFEAQRS